MRKNPVKTKAPAEQVVVDIRRATRKLHSSEEKIRIVLSGLRGEDSIAEPCREEGIAQSLYYSWSKEFLEAGKRRLAGATARQANTGEVKDLRAHDLSPSEIEGWVEDARRGMENALRANPPDIREQYEKQLKDPQEAYGEAMLELRARKKCQALLDAADDK